MLSRELFWLNKDHTTIVTWSQNEHLGRTRALWNWTDINDYPTTIPPRKHRQTGARDNTEWAQMTVATPTPTPTWRHQHPNVFPFTWTRLLTTTSQNWPFKRARPQLGCLQAYLQRVHLNSFQFHYNRSRFSAFTVAPRGPFLTSLVLTDVTRREKRPFNLNVGTFQVVDRRPVDFGTNQTAVQASLLLPSCVAVFKQLLLVLHAVQPAVIE